jgi:hypothetical protein
MELFFSKNRMNKVLFSFISDLEDFREINLIDRGLELV